MKRSFSTFVLVALLPLGALAAGCGGDDDDSTNTGGAAGTTGGAAGTTGGAAGTTAGKGGSAGTTGGKAGTGGTTGGAAGSTGGAAGTTGGAAGTTGGAAGTAGGAAGTTGGAAGNAGTSGNAGVAGNAGSGATSGAPATCDASHGAVGCCSADGTTNYYFGNGVVTDVCTNGEVCTWNADASYYACGMGPAAADPSGAAPLACGGTPLSADLSQCPVPCAKDADCASSLDGTLCDTTSGACVECLADKDCTADPAATVCSPSKTCVAPPCTKNADCASSSDGTLCDTTSGACVECLADKDCTADPAATVCGPSKTCGAPPCTKNADCASNQDGTFCDAKSGLCVACLVDKDCTDSSAPLCNGGSCVQCKDDSSCTTSANGPSCIADFGICGCAEDTNCATNASGAVCVSLGFGDLAFCGCNADTDCTKASGGPSCLEGVCAHKCTANTDCKDTTKPICDVPSGICNECAVNTDCKDTTKPVCSQNACVGCTADSDCAGNKDGKFCDTDNAVCVACKDDFGCTDPKAPSCVSGACAANTQCTGDDKSEDADDGPLGATDITPASGNTSSTAGHSICGLPAAESDYFKFTASDGDNVTLSLVWTDSSQDLDLTVTDAKGNALALNLFDASPANIILDYLPKGTYYVSVKRYDGADNAAATPYTVVFTRTTGNKCASITDCAKDSGNTAAFRGSCNATTGACTSIDGKKAVAKGGACDSSDDCSSGQCAETPFNESAAKYAVCTVACTKDADCGSGQVCTTFYQTNICVPKCTKDSECPVNFQSAPADGQHWPYLTCDTASGSCTLN